MMIVERWVDACSGVDLDATPLVKKEMKDFLGKMASLGSEYRAWSHRVHDKLKLEVSRWFIIYRFDSTCIFRFP